MVGQRVGFMALFKGFGAIGKALAFDGFALFPLPVFLFFLFFTSLLRKSWGWLPSVASKAFFGISYFEAFEFISKKGEEAIFWLRERGWQWFGSLYRVLLSLWVASQMSWAKWRVRSLKVVFYEVYSILGER